MATGGTTLQTGCAQACSRDPVSRAARADGEGLFCDWLLAMRHEHSMSMFGGEEGEGAAVTPGRAINFGQRDAALDLAAAIQNLQSPKPLLESPNLMRECACVSLCVRACLQVVC